MANNPFISVIVTAYNYRPYIVEALNSLRTQELDKESFDVIVVANFDQAEISRYLCTKWKFIQSKNRWIGPKVSEALKETSGYVVVFLEDDDLFERTKLKVIYDIFKQNQNLGFYRHKVKIINENGKEANLPYNLYNSGKIVIKKSRNIGKQYLLTYTEAVMRPCLPWQSEEKF
ncbi:glycosyltransferase family 2 protein [Acidianus infernus]|uniref:glycosyltransferase family 2 protein n=1 Tax=Acidianus infernus TaxID=12915 RepID=UPI0030B8102A